MEENNKENIIEVEKVTDNEESKVEQENKTEENKEEIKRKEVVEEKTKEEKDRRGFCIASLVLGIISLLGFWIWYISIPCAILAIIFGALGTKAKKKGMAIGGLVTGILGFILSILLVVIIFSIAFAIGITEIIKDEGYDSFEDFYDVYEHRNNYNRNYLEKGYESYFDI